MVVKLRWLVFAMVSIALVPLAVVAILAISTAHRDQRRDVDRALLERTRALGVAVDREVETSIAALKGLATSGDLLSGDLDRFREQAARAKEAHRHWLTVALIDPSGRQLINLLRPPGTPLAAVAESELFRRTVRTLRPEVSDLTMGVTAQTWTIVVNVPLLREGGLRYILSAVMTPEGFGSLLAAAQIPAGSVGTITDRKGVVVASTRASPGDGGTPPTGGEGVLRDTLDGRDAYTASSRAPARSSRWTSPSRPRSSTGRSGDRSRSSTAPRPAPWAWPWGWPSSSAGACPGGWPACHGSSPRSAAERRRPTCLTSGWPSSRA